MRIVNVTQGSPEWHAHRASHFNASDAPTMMGAGKWETRSQLIHRLATGEVKDVPPDAQRRFDRGHEAEEAARPIIEAVIGEELFPIVGVSEEHPRLSASYDGLTFTYEVGFEHKLWNADLAEKVRTGAIADDPAYYWQLEHQLVVCPELQRIHFTVSDGTEENCLAFTYTAVAGRREQLLAGWAQLEKDIAAYAPAAPKADVVAAPVETLPAIVYTIDRGTMALTSNLPAFRDAAESLVERTKAPLVTDQDFADREALCKAFGEAEKLLKMKAEEVIGQIEDVARFSRELGDIAEMFRTARLASEKLVDAEKKARRLAIQQGGEKALAEHVSGLQARFAGRVTMPAVRGDFAGVIKGKRTLSSIQDAVDTELAQRKIEANAVADAIDANLRILDEVAADHLFLFRDLQNLVTMPAEAFRAAAEGRVATHKAQEAARIEAEARRLVEQQAAQQAAEDAAQVAAQAGDKPAPKAMPIPDSQPAMKAYSELRRQARPSDAEIINLIATTYQVSAGEALAWIAQISTTEAQEA